MLTRTRTRWSLAAMLLLSTATTVLGSDRSAMDWLKAVDRNQVLKSAHYVATMTVHLSGGQERLFKMDGKVVGDSMALIEYLEPKRDQGTRYLKREGSLWIYFPRVDRTMQIQGHMLRQGVQGGDMSFEDLTESSSWEQKYNAEIVSEDAREVKIRMEAKDMTVSYPYREITIDKQLHLATHIVNRDASDQPIKEVVVEKTQTYGDRTYPTSTRIRSLLTEDKWTRFQVESIEFNVHFPVGTFTKRGLEQE